MENVLGFNSEHLRLSADVPVPVRQMVQHAIASYEDKPVAEQLFKQALALAPDELEIHVAFYKFYFYQKYLAEAEQVARQTLCKAAELTGLPADWRRLRKEFASWISPDSPVRYYLYTLKALGFIALRQEKLSLAHELLDKLLELDPDDRVGGSVIKTLANRMSEGDEFADD